MTLFVNGEKIEESEIKQEFERLRPHYEQVFRDQKPEEQKSQLLDWSKENVIEMVLIRQEAKKHGEPIPQADSAVTADLVLLCRGGVGTLSPGALVRLTSDRVTLVRCLGFWLAARATDGAAEKRAWQEMAEETSKGTLPWLYYTIKGHSNVPGSEGQEP